MKWNFSVLKIISNFSFTKEFFLLSYYVTIIAFI